MFNFLQLSLFSKDGVVVICEENYLITLTDQDSRLQSKYWNSHQGINSLTIFHGQFLNPLLKVFDEFCFIATISKVQKAKVVFYVEVATGADETWLVLIRQLVLKLC